jgi:hypothetical protein
MHARSHARVAPHAAKPVPHTRRWSTLCALCAADREVFSCLTAQFEVDAEYVEVNIGAAGRGLFFVKDIEANTAALKIPPYHTLLITDDPTGGSSRVGRLQTSD